MNINEIRETAALSKINKDDFGKNFQNSYQLHLIKEFQRIKLENPGLKKKEICKMIGVSDSSLKRMMRDLNIPSFYRYKIPVIKNQTTKNPETETKMKGKKTKLVKGGSIEGIPEDHDLKKEAIARLNNPTTKLPL